MYKCQTVRNNKVVYTKYSLIQVYDSYNFATRTSATCAPTTDHDVICAVILHFTNKTKITWPTAHKLYLNNTKLYFLSVVSVDKTLLNTNI